MYKGHLVADIMRRSPGRTISSDGTFRLMSRTTGSAQVLVLLLGADHSIIAYYVLKSEKWAEPVVLDIRRKVPSEEMVRPGERLMMSATMCPLSISW